MSVLTDQQIATLDRLLAEREQSLKAAVHEHLGRLRDIDVPTQGGLAGDMADQAEVEQERDHENVAVVRDVRELREVETARERMADGKAGVCVDCGEAIGFERLRVQPTALRCVPCQAASERADLLDASGPASSGGTPR